jgi:hypothetical protein
MVRTQVFGKPVKEICVRGRRMEFRTSLTVSDLKALPDIAFHGTKASELRFFDIGTEYFTGHMALVKPAVLDDLQQLFFGTMESIGVCLETASGWARSGFKKNGFNCLDAEDYPVILMAINQYPPYFCAKRSDLLASIIPSDREMHSIIRHTKEISKTSPDWKLSVLSSLDENIIKLLAQKILDTLERLAKH